jgi:hypothetical protein
MSALRTRAAAVVTVFAATIALGVVLLLAFDPEVQTIAAAELVVRSADARGFLIADYFFIVLYGVLSPIAIWRFGAQLREGGAPGWIRVGAVLLVSAGVVDATENTLLLAATGSISPDAVAAAHALAIPKVVLFVAGTIVAIAAVTRAIAVLIRGHMMG